MQFRLIGVFGNDETVVLIVPSVNDVYVVGFLVTEHVEVVTEKFHLGRSILYRLRCHSVTLGSD